MVKRRKSNTNFEVLEIGNNAVFVKFKTGKKRKTFKKRGKRVLAKADAPASGCRLSGTVYDHEANTTTFMYECDHAIDPAGHTSYTVTKRGYADLGT